MRFTSSLDGITPARLDGHFMDWPNKPAPEAHLRILEGSDFFVLAIDEETEHVVGWISAISDRVSSAFIPHLSVLPEFQGKGIGTELVRRCIEHYNEIYAIDLMCDEDVVPFYAKSGLKRAIGMVSRNYARQNCDRP